MPKISSSSRHSLQARGAQFRAADGGTVGGSAYDRILFFIALGLWSRTLTFQFLMVVAVVAVVRGLSKFCAQDRIQQRFGRADHFEIPVPHGRGGGEGLHGFLAQDDFLLPHPRTRLVLMLRILLGFFSHFFS